MYRRLLIKQEKKLHQPEKFICISYPQIDFLIPSDFVISAVSINDLDTSLLQDQTAGIFNFDDIASSFAQKPRDANVKTMMLLQGDDDIPVSFVTGQECKVSTIPLNKFSLFTDHYADCLKKIGLLACIFENERIKFLIDVKQAINHITGGMADGGVR